MRLQWECGGGDVDDRVGVSGGIVPVAVVSAAAACGHRHGSFEWFWDSNERGHARRDCSEDPEDPAAYVLRRDRTS